MSTLEVTFVSADRTVWSGSAAQVVVPAADGSMGILPRMQPTLAILERGAVRIIGEDGEVTERAVDGGFVSMDRDVVTIAVDHADRATAAR
ncbi:F0F1 ATP synthase subunit epsilon [Brachybacterium halotolerans subsp. kimchii]|uniref:F0F1 ATP synthase subunit epsilon n=1 Tax=Brachybacterium halotolerans TaxID=2795215 RepID=A0ABS1B6W0_9MICO|nr:F0F1 ATP synthase subunit epsilon [Brachybacterium halotolerans]MBK0330356.1 F0F1 ATP synthase subunit epsilon [Brachybacterium halotolerans]MCG7307951.1 F0F1 ATP synthase subunit epsilon [Brachybacterium sp. ACRRE]UEJ82882.1 F0F1 ATP synthase subunit epsilon [Brachybacterium halotolerans subsp. kimchii]